MSGLRISEVAGGVRFSIRVQPRSSKPGVGGLHGDALKVRVNAPPVDGAANEAVVEVLAEALGISHRRVVVVSGLASRTKIVEVTGVLATSVIAISSADNGALRKR